MIKEEGKRQEFENKEYIIKNKLNKQTLKSRDIKEIVYSASNSEDVEVDDNYKNHMKRFVELYNYIEGPNAFKGSNKQYQFKKEWHGLFLVLFDTLKKNPQFNRDKNKQINTVGTIKDYNKELVKAIEEYLPEDQKEYIISHPAYKLTIAEQKIYKKIEDNLQVIFNNIGIMPALKRFQNLVDINDYLELASMKILGDNMRYTLETNTELAMSDKRGKTIIAQELLEDLEELLDYELKIMMSSEEDLRSEVEKEYTLRGAIDKGESKNVIGKEIDNKMLSGDLNIKIPKDDSIMAQAIKKQKEHVEYMTTEILEEEDNRQILEKVSGVLDEGNAKEKSLKQVLEKMIIYMSTTNEEDDDERRNIRRIINMMRYNNTIERASRDD